MKKFRKVFVKEALSSTVFDSDSIYLSYYLDVLMVLR